MHYIAILVSLFLMLRITQSDQEMIVKILAVFAFAVVVSGIGVLRVSDAGNSGNDKHIQ